MMLLNGAATSALNWPTFAVMFGTLVMAGFTGYQRSAPYYCR